MSENFKEKIDDLEMIAANFKTATNSKITYMKEKITDLIKSGPKLPFEFEYLLVAFSRNGGLIAMCKQMNYYDRSKSRINDDILVMHQDAGKRYYIPLPLSNEEKRVQVSIINLEFNDDEQLYAFGSDGSLYKIDILTAKAVKKLNSPRLEDEGVTKVKLFEKGYIALTKKGNIYYVPDIKKQNPIFMINIKNQLKFSDNIDFIGIPPSKSKSGKFELLINNENGNGLLHIEKQDVDDSNNRIIERTVPVSLLVSGKLEKYDPEKNSTPSGGSESISSEKPKKGFLGKVSAICMSPSKSEIAVYCAQNTTAYIFPSNLDDLSSFEEMTFKKENLEEELEEDEVQEHLALFSYNKKYQFLFCGEQSLAICGQRFVVIITRKEEILSFKITDESAVASMTGSTLFTSISEIDGLRYLCEDGVFLISEVCKELYDVCYTFAKNPAKKLINAYGAFISKNADCDKQIRDISLDLPDAINTLQQAAVSLYFTEDSNSDINMKELQMILIKAAQYGKSFVQKGDFNYERYVEKCRAMRVINSLRNLKESPRFLTYKEYIDMDPESPNEFIKKILRHHNYRFAFELCNYLGYETDKIYEKFCISNIKRITDEFNVDKLFESLNSKLLECQNVSYITLAKKCIKHGKNLLAEKFLEQEKSIVVKVPQYLQLRNWKKALELAIESNDRTVIKVVIDKIYKVENEKEFIKTVGGNPKVHKAVIEYLRLHDIDKTLRKYLGSKGDYEELLYMTLENFFKAKKIGDRSEYIIEAKKYLKELKGNPNFNFYENYLKDLENSLRFKKECIEPHKFIETNDISPFDKSIFECYKLGISKDYKWIEETNKKIFNIGQKKLTYIRFKQMAERKQFAEIDEIIENTKYKNLDITPLEVAKIFFNTKNYDQAVNYIKKVTEQNDFEEKINLLKKMQKHKEALEIVMADRKADKQFYIEGILRERPDLKSFLDSLQTK